MNSDRAAEVRDAINALPCVAWDPDFSEYGGAPFTDYRGRTYTGEFLRLDGYAFRPARVNQAGEIGFGEDPVMRPLYEVVLEPLALPTRPLPCVSIPPDVVYEAAKFGCRIRVYSGRRGEYKPGLIKIRDDLQGDHDDEDGEDRCSECRSTRFRIRNGTLECARCNERFEAPEAEPHVPTLDDYAGGDSA